MFGIVSDTHFSSKYSAEEHVKSIYDDFGKMGIRQVFHAGDLVDGTGKYPGHEMNLNEIGFENQAQHFIKNYPHKKGMKTYFILGNHDTKPYLEREGADIGKRIALERKDMEYLGVYNATIVDQNKVAMEISHPDAHPAYTISYPAQKYIRNRTPTYQPHVAVFGHRHQMFYMNFQEVDILEAGAWQRAGPYVERMGINHAVIGGWAIEWKRDHNKVTQFHPRKMIYE